MAYVYIHKFPNGKIYVGATGIDPEKRWRAGAGYSNQPKVQQAIDEYGWENVKHYACRVDNIVTAERIESFLINALDAVNNGYNTLKASIEPKNDICFALGELIQRCRKDKGITQSELAEALGYSHKGMISQIESGKVSIPVQTMFKIVSLLEMDPIEIDRVVN